MKVGMVVHGEPFHIEMKSERLNFNHITQYCLFDDEVATN